MQDLEIKKNLKEKFQELFGDSESEFNWRAYRL